MRIPKIAFAIWYGGMLPKNAQENLIKLKQLNSDYDVRLISDPDTMADEDYGLLVQFCSDHNINLVNIRESSDEFNGLITAELDKSIEQTSLKLKKIHYVRASDLTRCSALYTDGGIYIEPDITPKKPFGTLSSSTGLLVTVYDPTMKVAESVSDIDILISLNYDFIIAAPQLRLFREALLAHQQDQEYFQSLDDNLLFQESSSRQGLRAYVIATTGSLLFYCLTQFLSQNMASIKQNQDILIASTIVARDNDNIPVILQNTTFERR